MTSLTIEQAQRLTGAVDKLDKAIEDFALSLDKAIIRCQTTLDTEVKRLQAIRDRLDGLCTRRGLPVEDIPEELCVTCHDAGCPMFDHSDWAESGQ